MNFTDFIILFFVERNKSTDRPCWEILKSSQLAIEILMKGFKNLNEQAAIDPELIYLLEPKIQ